MDFYIKHNLDYKNFKVVLSCWRGESSWRFLQVGFPCLVKPKNKSKTELRILDENELTSSQLSLNLSRNKLRIRIDQYEWDWLDKGISNKEGLYSQTSLK